MEKYETTDKYLPINQWHDDDRPREKLLLKGRNAMSDSELMAILIGSGSKNESAVALSKRILNSVDNNLLSLSKLSINDLMTFKGIGEAKAISIIAALELGMRQRRTETLNQKFIKQSKDAFEIFLPAVGHLQYESFWIGLLNRANGLIKIMQISDGGLTATIADPRRIFKLAIENSAVSLLLCHNHPSGNIKPSQQDIDLTKKIKNGATQLDLQVIDHIIIGDQNYFSFADEGIL